MTPPDSDSWREPSGQSQTSSVDRRQCLDGSSDEVQDHESVEDSDAGSDADFDSDADGWEHEDESVVGVVVGRKRRAGSQRCAAELWLRRCVETRTPARLKIKSRKLNPPLWCWFQRGSVSHNPNTVSSCITNEARPTAKA
eukprot:2126351-Rhodomonas_salina.1